MGRGGPRPKLSKADIARAVALKRKGQTLKQIAKALGCSISLVSIRLREAEAAGAHVPAARTGRPRKRPTKGTKGQPRARRKRGKKAPPAPPEDDPEFGKLFRRDCSKLPDGPTDALDELRSKRLPEIAKMLRWAIADGDLVRTRDLFKLEIEFIERINGAAPPDELKPEDDPANRRARDAVRARIVEATKRHVADLCDGCRQSIGAGE